MSNTPILGFIVVTINLDTDRERLGRTTCVALDNISMVSTVDDVGCRIGLRSGLHDYLLVKETEEQVITLIRMAQQDQRDVAAGLYDEKKTPHYVGKPDIDAMCRARQWSRPLQLLHAFVETRNLDSSDLKAGSILAKDFFNGQGQSVDLQCGITPNELTSMAWRTNITTAAIINIMTSWKGHEDLMKALGEIQGRSSKMIRLNPETATIYDIILACGSADL